MQQMASVPPALADLLQVASMVTPDQTPTVAAQVAGAAQQMMAPQMAPQAPMQGGMQQPSVQDVAQQAGLGGQIQGMQQQQLMQALQQMAGQQQQQQNAMRFGVAAAPGAQTIRMADGGIVGYAGGEEVIDLGDLEEQKRRLARLRAREAARAAYGAVPEAVEAVEDRGKRGILSALGRLAPVLGVATAASELAPEETKAGLLNIFPGAKMLAPAIQSMLGGMGGRPAPAGQGGRPTMPNDPRIAAAGLGPTPPEETAGAEAERARNMAQVAGTAGQTPPPAPPRAPAGGPAAGPARPAAAPQTGILTPTGPSQADRYVGEAQAALKGYETTLPGRPAAIERLQQEQAATDAYLRSQGVDPEQYKKDLAESEARKKRKLEGIESLQQEREASRSGMPGLIRLLASAGGRTDPLRAIGMQYGNMTAERLADNERFMNARERAMDAEDVIQAALREKRRAEVVGNIKEKENALLKEMEARNKQRDAQIQMATELAKMYSGKEEKALDREAQQIITKMQVDAQKAATAASREGANEVRRATALNSVMRDEERAIAAQEAAYQRSLAGLGIFPGVTPSKDQQAQVQRLMAERDAAIARIRNSAAESRAMLMGGGAGANFQVREKAPK